MLRKIMVVGTVARAAGLAICRNFGSPMVRAERRRR
jgi:hypothetical protein